MNKLWVMVIFSMFTSWLQSAQAADEKNPYVEYRIRTYEIQEAYLRRIAEHQQKIMTDLEEKLVQQKRQTTVISVMVVVMVLFGLILSGLQFYSDYKNKGKSSITFTIGSGSIEIKSTVIGLAILAMSFWFFQTYVDKVYSIQIFQMPSIDFTGYGING